MEPDRGWNMTRSLQLLITAAALTAALGCQSTRYSAAGFQLPADGSVERGKQAFVTLGCHGCHDVTGAGLVRTVAPAATPVVLGGDVVHRFSDGYLVTSMIYPNRELAAAYPKAAITAKGVSRMPSFADQMTVRQMIDTVAFLQANYQERTTPPYTPMTP